MPLDLSDFPEDVQVAFFVMSMLKDKWDTMGGLYLGKDWSDFSLVIELYGFENQKKIIFFIIKLYENLLMNYRAEQSERERKKQEGNKPNAPRAKNVKK